MGGVGFIPVNFIPPPTSFHMANEHTKLQDLKDKVEYLKTRVVM